MPAIKIESKYRTSCQNCNGSVDSGEYVFWTPGVKGVVHTECNVLTKPTKKIAVEKRLALEPPTPRPDFPGLFEHQREVVNTVEKQPALKAYLAWEPGLGKTLGSLASAKVGNNFPLIVVCPSVVKINWQREVQQWLGIEAQILSSRTPYEITSDVVIINYDVLEAWKESLIALNAKGIVFDECQYIKNPESQRAIAAVDIAENIPGMKLMLSGTPTKNSVYDLVVPLKILEVLDDFGGEQNYVRRYCPPVTTRWGVSHAKATHKEELRQNLLNSCFVRRRRGDCMDLPEKIRVDIPVAVKVEVDHDFYAPLVEQMSRGTLAEAERVLRELPRVEIEGQMAAERQAAGVAKINDIAAMATDIEDPLVVMVHHHEVVDQLMTKLKRRRPVKLVGGQTMKARQKAIDAFQGGDTDLVIASITAAGTGINLQRGTAMIIGELPLTAAEMEQAESRCHRAGAKNDLTVYRMVALGTFDEIAVNIIARKEATSAAVEDGEEIDIVYSGDIIAKKLLDYYRGIFAG